MSTDKKYLTLFVSQETLTDELLLTGLKAARAVGRLVEWRADNEEVANELERMWGRLRESGQLDALPAAPCSE